MSARPRESRSNLPYSLLDDLLGAEGVTNRALAKHLGMNETTISSMVNGKRPITKQTQAKIYEYLALHTKKGG
jgi:plasmid maintenance system antidote protein VapI